MTVSVNSYGTSEKVAGYVPRYAAASGDFDTTTNPTQARVEGIIDRVSGLVNAYLKALGFTIPLTNADNVLAMENIVMEVSAVVVEGIRGSGRYAPNSKAIANRSMWAVLNDDIMAYLDAIAEGLEADETYTQPNDFRSRSPIRSDGYSDDYTVIET
jgi:hypothetical protein